MRQAATICTGSTFIVVEALSLNCLHAPAEHHAYSDALALTGIEPSLPARHHNVHACCSSLKTREPAGFCCAPEDVALNMGLWCIAWGTEVNSRDLGLEAIPCCLAAAF